MAAGNFSNLSFSFRKAPQTSVMINRLLLRVASHREDDDIFIKMNNSFTFNIAIHADQMIQSSSFRVRLINGVFNYLVISFKITFLIHT